jgi:dTDP-4-amino-4,6-dideoxygalactose transaminase
MSDVRDLSPKPAIVPVSDPARSLRARQVEVERAMRDVLLGGSYVLGPQVERLEQEFAAWLGIEAAIGVANGTDALELALRGCQVPEDSLVAIPALTASATAAAVVRAGLRPLIIDIDPSTLTMCPERLRGACRAVRRSGMGPVAAVVPVHLYGLPCDMTALGEFCAAEGLLLVEDCAQSHGSTLAGRPMGTWGLTAAFSCYPTKNLAALGDAGIVVTTDATVARRIRELRQYGWIQRHVSQQVGMNSRLDELQAAILRIQLAHLDSDNDRRREVCRRYDQLLSDLPLRRPRVLSQVKVCPHQYVILHPQRSELAAHLARTGIQTSVLYPTPICDQPAYARFQSLLETDGGVAECVSARNACNTLLCLPLHPLLTDDEIQRVIAAVRGFFTR